MSILKKPLITEKITAFNEKGVYGFIVDKKADKAEIKKALEQMYGVNITNIRTMRYGGKPKNRFTKAGVVSGKTSAYKKAIVQIADGQIIDFYGDI